MDSDKLLQTAQALDEASTFARDKNYNIHPEYAAWALKVLNHITQDESGPPPHLSDKAIRKIAKAVKKKYKKGD